MTNNIFKGKACLLYRKHETINFEDYVNLISKRFKGLIFKTIDRDAVGRSSGNPRWGHVFEYKDGRISKNNRIAVYKEPDYDEPDGPYAEKIWSILGKLVLPDCKIPEIDVIWDKKNKLIPGVISYSIVDKQREDMIDMRTILRYNSIKEEELRKNDDRLNLDELLNYVKNYIGDEKEYNKIESQIIRAILLDCITNNFDRHPDNWALIREISSGTYTLGLYDNTVSFVNMLNCRPGVVNSENWGKIFILVSNHNNKQTDMSDEVVKYICNKYPEYSKEFFETFDRNLNEICEQIKQNKFNEIIKCLNKRKNYIKRLVQEDREFDD